MADFADALRALKDGKRVTRAVWTDGRHNWRGAYMAIHHFDPPYEPQIMVEYSEPGHPVRPFGGAQWDILADDWEILEDGT